MKITRALSLGLMLALMGPAVGAVAREIGSAELRKIVGAGQAISLKSAVSAIAKATKAEPIEARAFEIDGIYYRILIKLPDGSLASVIIDAESGRQVSSSSAIAKQVGVAASDKTSKAKGAKSAANPRNNGQSGGSSGSNSGGNGGGGGKGNSGGKGGGGGKGGKG